MGYDRQHHISEDLNEIPFEPRIISLVIFIFCINLQLSVEAAMVQ